jgi:UDP-2,3-diacylglucosamine hydrolase
MEWKNLIIKDYFDIFYIFKKLKENGCRLVFTCGNHDFWIGDFLKDHIGFEIYKQHFTLEINNQKIYIEHGDQHTTNDWRFKLMYKIIKKPVIQKMASLLHPQISLYIGSCVSRTHPNRKKSDYITAQTENELLQKANQLSKNNDIIIFAHSHKPCTINLENCQYLNTGDWVTNNSFILLDEKGPQLIKSKP